MAFAAFVAPLSAGIEEPVSYVNAPQLAAERGLEVKESKNSTAYDYVNLITLRGDRHSVAGTLVGARGGARLVMVDDHKVEVPPTRHMLVIHNDDRIGMIALVSGAVAEARVNISNMAIGKSPNGETALMVMATDGPVPPAVTERLAATPGILDVSVVQD